ncbi:amidase [Brevibacterium album]|uniref:amidase n=1 Tax=Brevibacterium album TaxID=417948 RepID=UPI000428A869|nr:amidase family protein [Brevibacterium album]
MTDLTWLSTRELAACIRTGQTSAREALEAHLARIDEVNPALNAVVTVDAEAARARAEAADAAYAAGERLGLLHGVPMTHKDTHDTRGMRTTLGSPVFADRVPDEDALIVARLGRAGVVTTGKSNVPEFAAGSHTFNPVFGTTVNPYDTSRSSGGSSGGVSSAIAAGIQASGDGSDMGGSLRTPGSFTNTVGLRPSNGRIPHHLPGRPWAWLGQMGFMAREVSDVALLMQAAAGPAAGAPCSIREGGEVFDRPEFTRDGQGEGLRGLRIGFSADLDGRIAVESAVRAVVESARGVFESAGAHVDETVPDLDDADEVFRVNRAYDFVCSNGEVVRRHRDRVKESVVWNTEMGFALTVDELVAAEAGRGRLLGATEEFFGTHDLLVTTTCQVLPFDAELEYPQEIEGRPMENYLEWMRAATLVSATGCPAITVPAGFTDPLPGAPLGLPVGIQIVAAPGKDVELLLAAKAFEELTGHHRIRPRI